MGDLEFGCFRGQTFEQPVGQVGHLAQVAAEQLCVPAHILEHFVGFVALLQQLLGVGSGDLQQTGLGTQDLAQGFGLDERLEE